MRHLIDTYIEAATPRIISPFENMPLLELIETLGITAAIATLPDGIKSSTDAIAEAIANNVRSKIIKEHLNDPAYYAKMSKLLEEIIANLRAKRVKYAEYLKQIAELAKNVQAGQATDTPEPLKHSPGLRALYNNLLSILPSSLAETSADYMGDSQDRILNIALQIDSAVKTQRPDSWRGVHAREQVVKRAIYGVVNSEDVVERIFPVLKQQAEY